MIRLFWSVLFLVCVLLVTSRAEIVHPGVLLGRADLDRIRDRVAAGEQPWAGAYAVFRNYATAKSSYAVLGGRAEVGRNPDVNRPPFENDSVAAFHNAIQWYVTGDQAHANKAIQILNSWAATLTTISGTDARLMAGNNGWKFAAAGEILRHTGAGYSETDAAALERMLLNVVYPVVAINGDANWGTCQTYTAMTIGVFCNRQDIFDEAVWNHRNHPGSSAARYILPAGIVGESGRDQAHTQGGIGHLALAAELAWLHGLDLYSDEDGDTRIRAAFDYTAKYNLGDSVPFYNFGTVNVTYGSISSLYRGRLTDTYEMVYNHYTHRRGLSAPNIERMLARVRPEAAGNDHSSIGTLLHTQQPATAAGDYAYAGRYRILTSNGKALGTASGAVTTGTRIEQTSPTSAVSQQWELTPVGGGNYVITNVAAPTLIIDSSLEPSVVGRSPVLANNNAQLNGMWRIVERGDGTVQIIARDTLRMALPLVPLAWGIPSASVDSNGAVIILENSSDAQGQGFQLVRVNPGATPLAPAAPQAISGDGVVTLSWAPSLSSGSTTYSVYRSITKSAGYVALAGATGLASTTFADTTVVNGTVYYYYISAQNGTVSGPSSAVVTARPFATPSAAPADLVAVQGGSARHVTLGWTPLSGASSYTVRRSEAATGPFEVVAREVVGARFTDSARVPGKTYYYTVAGANKSGEGPASAAISFATTLRALDDAREVGAPNMRGVSEDLGGGRWRVSGSGAGWASASVTPTTTATNEIGGTTDAFHFRYQAMAGDGELVARVESLAGSNVDKGIVFVDTLAKAGLMVRESLDPGARRAFIGVTGGSGAVFLGRATTGGSTTSSAITGIAAPYWVRLVRSGTTFTGFISSNGSSWTSVGSVTLPVGTTVYAGLAACSRQVKGMLTAEFSGVSVPAPAVAPAAPTGLGAVAGNAQVALSWNAVPGATSYAVKRSLSSNRDTYVVVGTTTGTSLTNTALTNGQLYYYTVSAIGAAGESLNPDYVTATPLPPPPPAPTGVTAFGGFGYVVLNWSAVSGATSYTVKRALVAGGPYAVVGSGSAANTFTDQSVANDTTYYYVVSATGLGGQGVDSSVAAGTPVSTPPPAPGAPTIRAGDRFVALDWTAVLGAETYLVKRGTSAAGPFTTLVAGLTSPSFVDSTTANGTTYHYVVASVNGAGVSAVSPVVSIAPFASATVALAGVSSQDGQVTAADATNAAGGSIDSSATTALVGDTAAGLQQKAIFAFDTSSLPDDAQISAASLVLRRAAVVGTPFTDLGALGVDIKGYAGFSFASGLATADFAALADATSVATLADPGANGAFATASISAPARSLIDISGVTQFRLAFATASDADSAQDTIAWSTANDSTAANRPALNLTYSVPDPGLITRLEAEAYTTLSGITFQDTNDTGGGKNTTFASNNDWLRFDAVDFDAGVRLLRARIAIQASGPAGSRLEFRIGSSNGTLLGTIYPPVTGNWGTWTTRTVEVDPAVAKGVFNLVVVFRGSTSPSTLINLNWIEFGVPTPAPTTPSSLTATGGNGQISLAWPAGTSAARYLVRRAVAGTSAYVTLGTTTALNYQDTGLVDGASYDYRVAAVNAAGESDDSPVATATTFTALERWRLTYFGAITGTGSAADNQDPDGDGWSNLQEYRSGTSPVDAASALRILSLTVEGADHRVTFTSALGVVYRLEASDDLSPSWLVLAEDVPGTGEPVEIVIPDAAGAPRRFYRVAVP